MTVPARLRAPRVSVVKSNRGRRGQTLILALAILFLFVVLGSIFITSVLRNLQRTARQGETDDATTLALAGLQFAAEQFKSSAKGADWRPEPSEFLWRTPAPPPGTVALPAPYGTVGYDVVRGLDPDYPWLNENSTGLSVNPYVRYPTGRGRFLLRVSYVPRYVEASAASSGIPDISDQNSRMIHIESVGRPGEFDPDDPSFLNDPTVVSAGQPNPNPTGAFRKVEAFVPVGLVDQLEWITNFTHERGPASIGSPPFFSSDGRPLECPSLFYGGIRSEVSLQFHGRSVVRIYPARGESLDVNGNILLSVPGNRAAGNTEPPLRIDIMADAGGPSGGYPPAYPPGAAPVLPPDTGDRTIVNDTVLVSAPVDRESTDPTFGQVIVNNSVVTTPGKEVVNSIRDHRHFRSDLEPTARSIQGRQAPVLNEPDPATGIGRLQLQTRHSGQPIELPDATPAGVRQANTGEYSLCNVAPPAGLGYLAWQAIRAKGLYLDNFADIQYRDNRSRVKNDWLRRGSTWPDAWNGKLYIPYAPNDPANPGTGGKHEIAIIELTQAGLVDPTGAINAGNPLVPKIKITRFDPDVRQANPYPDTGKKRQFYMLNNVTAKAAGGTKAGLTPAGFTQYFDYPENGVLYAEGSVRVMGTAGMAPDAAYQDPAAFQIAGVPPANRTLPRALTIVSGGTVYIEGNLTKATPAWQVGLLANDYITLNPTAFTTPRLVPSSTLGAPQPDVPGDPSQGFHWVMDAGTYMDLNLPPTVQLPNGAWLHMRHSGEAGDKPVTTFVLYQPRFGGGTPWPDWNTDRYGFTPIPPNAPFLAEPIAYTNPTGLFYMFRQIPPGDPDALAWNLSNRFSSPGGVDWERKTFALPGPPVPPIGSGASVTYRLEVVPKDSVTNNDPNLADLQDHPYWLSNMAVTAVGQPLPIKVEAVMYAFTGSWFVIPPPYFGDGTDTRANFLATGQRNGTQTDPPSQASNLTDASLYPFDREPLNVDIQIHGAITENMPAEPTEVAEWMRHLWTGDLDGNAGTPDNDPTVWPPTDPDSPGGVSAVGEWTNGRALFSPRITYWYDQDLRGLVRAHVMGTSIEEVVWAGTLPGPIPGGVRTLAAFVNDPDGDGNADSDGNGIPDNQERFVETLPLLPRLPSAGVVYEGNPL